jgi:immunity protein 52 of polymorphic toxin system
MADHQGVPPPGDQLSAGVYWGDRPESAGQCAGRYLRMINALEAGGFPASRDWRAAVTGRQHPAPMIMDVHAVEQLLLAGGEYTNSGGAAVPELGYRLRATSGGEPPGVALGVRCAVSAGQPGLVNGVVLGPSGREPAPGNWTGLAPALIRSLVEAWEPDWGFFGPHSLRRAQEHQHQARGPFVGAVTYLSRALGPLPRLPAAAAVRHIGPGSLVSLTGGDRLPDPQRVLELASLLRAAGLLAAIPQVQAGAAGAAGAQPSRTGPG